MKLCFVWFLLFSVLYGCGTESLEADAVRKTFTDYKDAVVAADGAAAVRLITQRTVDEYQKYTDWARTANRTTLDSLSAFSKIQVLLIKHRLPNEKLLALHGETVFSYAVDQGWVGEETVMATTIDDIQVSGDSATARVHIDNKKTPNRYRFSRESGAWKFDLLQTMQAADQVLASQIEQTGLSENDFILRMLEGVSGRKPTETISEPLKP